MAMSRETRAARLRAQLLHPPGVAAAEDVVTHLLAVQAQDSRAFRLAVRSRSTDVHRTDVDGALSEQRSLVVTWLLRGTLHLVTSTDYWWLHGLTAPRMATGIDRRLRQLGLDEATVTRGTSLVLDAVRSEPHSRGDLKGVLTSAGIPTEGQALVHLLAAASTRHHVVRGPVRAGEQCYVDAETWLPPPAEHTRDDALAWLAERYLAGHGSAAPEDLAAYAGITLTDARRAFELIEDQTTPVATGLRALPDGPTGADMPPPRMLGMFDPILHGWKDRTFLTGRHRSVVTTNGLFRATALVDGRVAATWTMREGTVHLRPLERITRASLEALEQEAADIARFLDLPTATFVVDRD